MAKIVGKSGADSRKDWGSRQNRAEQIAGKAVADGKEGGGDGRKGGARMGKTIGSRRGEEDVKS